MNKVCAKKNPTDRLNGFKLKVKVTGKEERYEKNIGSIINASYADCRYGRLRNKQNEHIPGKFLKKQLL